MSDGVGVVVRGCPALASSPRPFGLPALAFFACIGAVVVIALFTLNLVLAAFLGVGSLWFGINISIDDPDCGLELAFKSLDEPEDAFA